MSWLFRLNACSRCLSRYLMESRFQWLRTYAASVKERFSVCNYYTFLYARSSLEVASNLPTERQERSPDTENDSEVTEDSGTIQQRPWRPRKRLSRHEMNHLRTLKELNSTEWTPEKLSKTFGISKSAVKRILHSKFVPSAEVEERQEKKVKELKHQRREKFLSTILQQSSQSSCSKFVPSAEMEERQEKKVKEMKLQRREKFLSTILQQPSQSS